MKLNLPRLEGKDVVEHFYNVGEKQAAPYRNLLTKLATSKLPPLPKVFTLNYFIGIMSGIFVFFLALMLFC